MKTAVVRTSSGTLAGTAGPHHGSAVFKGVPCARPPVCIDDPPNLKYTNPAGSGRA